MNPQPHAMALMVCAVAVIVFLIFMLLTEGCARGLPPEPSITIVDTCARDASR